MFKIFTRNLIRPLLILFLLLFEGISFSLMAQQTLSPGVDSVVVTFKNIPTQFSVEKAPLKYNKAFAMSFQEDDALSDIYNLVYPAFHGTNGSNGLYYTDGCGNRISFKMSSAIFIFAANGADILDPNDPYHDNSKLTWPELDSLYKNHWGINNHGLFDNPDVSSPGIINYAFQRTKSYTRRMISDSMKIKSFVIPNNVVTFVNYLSQNHYHSAINQGQDNTWIGYGKNGFNVESDTINWLKPVTLFRDFSYSGFKTMADTLYNASLRGEHRWYLSGMHQMPGGFLTDMTSIYQTYGAPGLDDILITTDDDLLDYFAVKQITKVHNTLKGNRLVITFSGAVPTDLLHYVMSLNVIGNENIQDIQVYGAKQFSSRVRNSDTALINFSWNGAIYQTPAFLADSFSNLAMKTASQWDALVAMDYVLKMPKGDAQLQLRKELCSLDRSGWTSQYDKSFCGFPDLGNDTTICAGSWISFKGPTNVTSYQWSSGDSIFSTADSVKVYPKVSTQYFLTVKNLQGQIETDSVWINVLPSPTVNLGKDTVFFSLDTLKFTAPSGPNYSYLWNTGDTTKSLTVETKWNTLYNISVKVTNQAGCVGQDTVHVTLPPKDSVPKVSVFSDTVLSCNGSEVTLKASSNTTQLFWSWAGQEVTTDSGSLTLSPAQSEMIYVKACNQYGCSQEDSVYVLFDVPPTVQISGDTSVCLGDSVFLTVSGGRLVQWFNKTDSISTANNIKRRPFRTTVYSVETWNRTGCISKDSVTVDVKPLPQTKILYDTNRVCQGTTVVLTSSGADNYQWLPENTAEKSLPVVVNDTMKINLIGTNVDGCRASDSVELLAVNLPKTRILYDTNYACQGTMVTLKASGANTYHWAPQNLTDSAISVTVNDTLKVNLTGTNNEGCFSGDSVEIYPLAIPKTKILYDSNYVCQGSFVTLKASGANTYEWTPQNKTGSTLPVAVNYPLKIDLTGRSAEGCESIDSVELYPIKAPETKILYDTNRVCQGTSIKLTASGADTYRWLPKDTSGLTLPITLNHEMKVNLIGFNKDGCSSVDSIELSPLPLPDVSFSGLLGFYCNNELPVTLKGYPSGGIFSGDGMEGNVFSPSKAGTGDHEIAYSYISKQGCSAKSVKSTEISGQIPTITLFPSDTTLKSGGFVHYDAGSGFTHYYWTTGDTTREITVNYNKAFLGEDTIKVEGLIDNCVSVGSAFLRFSKITGVPESRIKLTSVFPNPNQGQFFMNYTSSRIPFIIKVYNFSGKTVFEEKHPAINGDDKIEFDLTKLKVGIYFVCLYGKTEVTVAKVIIQ